MIETSFQKLMASSSDLLAEIKGEQSQIGYSLPTHTYHGVLVLAPNGYEWKDVIINVYNERIGDTENFPNCSVVVHGHDREAWCNAFHFCHVYGYTPVGHEHPGFLKRWKEKWGDE